MNIIRTSLRSLVIILAVALIASPAFAQESPSRGSSPSRTGDQATGKAAATPATASGVQGDAEMQKMMADMMEMGKTGPNHKILAGMAGDWTYTVKMWMDPKGKPQESKGTATRKAVMEGRYFIAEHAGKFSMPGPDGKMQDMDFKGMAIEGYDNPKKKFVSSWIDNMSTMIINSEGDYDPATKTFTYHAECEMTPGKTTKIREVIKIVDNDHYTFEWYDNARGAETKTMEISYTRKK